MAIQDFTSGQVLTAAQMDSLQANDFNQTVSTKTANYTLVAADKGTRVVMNAAGATTITVDDSLFTAGDTLQLQNIGAGVTTVTAGTATVSSAGPLAIPQYGSGTLFFSSAGVAIYFPSAVTIPTVSSGLSFITNGTVTAQTAVTVSNCFSSTYDNYLLIISEAVASVSGYNLQIQYGIGSADTAATYYLAQNNAYSSASTFHNFNQLGTAAAGLNGGGTVQIQSPNLATATNTQSVNSAFKSTTELVFGTTQTLKATTTQYTSIFFTAESPENVSFKYAIYGYAKS
jgi:hypothetical protein